MIRKRLDDEYDYFEKKITKNDSRENISLNRFYKTIICFDSSKGNTCTKVIPQNLLNIISQQ